MPNPIVEEWKHVTMLIKNESGKIGTGFLVKRDMEDKQYKLFLVTNKHVIDPDPNKRNNAKAITLHCNVEKNDGTIEKEEIHYMLDFVDGAKAWREHVDADTDVLAIDITPIIAEFGDLKRKHVTYDLLADKKTLEEYNITIGDEIAVIGYPLGLKHKSANYPLFRKGTIASNIGEQLEISMLDGGKERDRNIRGFLIDGATSPGSSGSPVILYPGIHFKNGNNVEIRGGKPFLLGIVSESRIAIVEHNYGDYPNLSGLSIIFDADTIKETIELFFQI
ncbi:MAG: S1 family peptidase [Nitrosotalea sp.]